MIRFLIVGILFLNITKATAQAVVIPAWTMKAIKTAKFDRKYELSSYLKPSFLQADFNGDTLIDAAVLVTEKSTQKKGILIVHNGKNQYFFFGAGTKFGSGADDYAWADGWKVYQNKIASETHLDSDGDVLGGKEVVLKRPGVIIWKNLDGKPVAGGIIYWDLKKYIWIHQGE